MKFARAGLLSLLTFLVVIWPSVAVANLVVACGPGREGKSCSLPGEYHEVRGTCRWIGDGPPPKRGESMSFDELGNYRCVDESPSSYVWPVGVTVAGLAVLGFVLVRRRQAVAERPDAAE